MGNNRKAILERAKIEIEQMYCAGIDGIIVEDFLCKSNEVEPALAWLRKQYPEKIFCRCCNCWKLVQGKRLDRSTGRP